MVTTTRKCAFILLITILMHPVESSFSQLLRGPAAPEFSRFAIFKPRIYHGRDKRQISSTRQNQDGLEHFHDITIVLDIKERAEVLDLRLNRELIPKGYFEKHQKNGSSIIRRPGESDVELCHYQGKLRGVDDSWAALSTCHGLSGVVFDGKELLYVEKATNSSNIHDTNHFLYSHSDLVTNHTCGYEQTADHAHDFYEINKKGNRFKRSDKLIRGPYNANVRSRYVELLFVIDNATFKKLGENTVSKHCKDIANIINALYLPLNIFIALVGVVMWTEQDEIVISPNGDDTLTNFLSYRQEILVKDYPNDNAQLLTGVQFVGRVVGKALKGTICTISSSGGVIVDNSEAVGLVALTAAHEMGHNFGMDHDSIFCQCPEDLRCIMSPFSSSVGPNHWSSCSLDSLVFAFGHGMDYCLRNKPNKLFKGPVCGNGFVEIGEQCDCGHKDHCTNTCCDPTKCTLFSNATCATGECCDLTTCQLKTVGTLCRDAKLECDLAEYCTGLSEYCPEDVFKMDGSSCNKNKTYCYKGFCRTHSDQCKLLWGPSGKSEVQCYKMNTMGTRNGNCGYDWLKRSYIKCHQPDLQCGMLQCTHLNERLEFGTDYSSIAGKMFSTKKGKTHYSTITCHTVNVDLGLDGVDPGLTPDGARCGEGKMCVNQKCISLENMWAAIGTAQCPGNCNNNGVCNNHGQCHCNIGFAPPNCNSPGPGGSLDSGPASDPIGY